jgi:hypothetical protein
MCPGLKLINHESLQTVIFTYPSLRASKGKSICCVIEKSWIAC